MKNNKTVSLKELRERFPKYIAEVAEGHSFTVIKRSKPIFQINPIDDTGEWQTIADFTKIQEDGVGADAVLDSIDRV